MLSTHQDQTQNINEICDFIFLVGKDKKNETVLQEIVKNLPVYESMRSHVVGNGLIPALWMINQLPKTDNLAVLAHGFVDTTPLYGFTSQQTISLETVKQIKGKLSKIYLSRLWRKVYRSQQEWKSFSRGTTLFAPSSAENFSSLVMIS